MRALGVSRVTLHNHLGLAGGGVSAGWRTWERDEVSRLAFERALITACLSVVAARSLAKDVVPYDTTTATRLPDAWVSIVALPDRWVWRFEPTATSDAPCPRVPWPVITLHPRSIVAAALESLDSDTGAKIAKAKQPNVRPAVRDNSI